MMREQPGSHVVLRGAAKVRLLSPSGLLIAAAKPPRSASQDCRWIRNESPAQAARDVCSQRERLALVGNDHPGGVPLHLGHELVGARFDDRKRAVVAGNQGIEIEEWVARV